MPYRIKEVETNVMYDDVYLDLLDAVDVVKTYVKDDRLSDPPRDVTYIIVDEFNGLICYSSR